LGRRIRPARSGLVAHVRHDPLGCREQVRTLTPRVAPGDRRVLGSAPVTAPDLSATFLRAASLPVAIAAFGKDDAITLAGTAALVMLLAVIYVRGQMYHLNPTLAVAGYGLYEVTETNETVTMLLTRRTYLAQTQPIACRYIGDYVAIHTGDAK